MEAAEAALKAYSPGFLSRFFNRHIEGRATLQRAVDTAKEEDRLEMEKLHEEHARCAEIKAVADAVLRGDTSRYVDALGGAEALDEINEHGTDVVVLALDLPPEGKVVPSEMASLTRRDCERDYGRVTFHVPAEAPVYQLKRDEHGR